MKPSTVSTALFACAAVAACALVAAPIARAQRIQFPTAVEQPAVITPPNAPALPAPTWQAQAPAAPPMPTYDPYAPAVGQPAPAMAPYSPYAPAPYAPPPYAPGPYAAPAESIWSPTTMFSSVGQYSGLAADICLRRRFWIQMDYIGWWGKGNPLPVLAVTSPAAPPPTSTLYGGDSVATELQSGARINAGFWLTDDQLWAIEEQVFYLAPISTSFTATSLDTPFIFRPFDLFPGNIPSLFPVSDPTIPLVGSLDIDTTANVLGAGILLRRRLWMNGEARLDLLGGYRFFRLHDSVTITQSNTTAPPLVPIFYGNDVFSATNYFNGGDVGLKFQKYFNRFSLEAIAKIAMGNVTQRVVIAGDGLIVGLVPVPVGFLAQLSNIGTYSRNVFALLPELDVNLRVDITQNLRAVVGYNLMYLNKVQRSGDAIDTAFDTTQFLLPGAGPPTFAFQNSTYWLQGINVGFEYRF